MKLVAATVALVLLAGALGSVRATSAPSLVTLNVGHYRNANGVLVTVFAGTISSNAAGETVDILGQDCGIKGSRLISGTHTSSGGGYRVENPLSEPPWRYTPVGSGVTYRARWNDQLSEPRVYRTPAYVGVRKVGRRAWRVYTSPPHPGTLSMKGKRVELQRLTGGSWRTIQHKALAFKPRYAQYGGPYNHEAVFKVAQRGWRLRAFLPTESAAPCYAAGVSAEWRS